MPSSHIHQPADAAAESITVTTNGNDLQRRASRHGKKLARLSAKWRDQTRAFLHGRAYSPPMFDKKPNRSL